MATDVSDLTFRAEVIDRSAERPVIVDLWAPWCGPCRTLGPILEKVVEDTEGAVELVKVNVDENPQISAAFQVQSIPAVFALSGRQVVDSFIGALPEQQVRDFVGRLVKQPSPADLLVANGDETSLRGALDLVPDHHDAIVALADLLVRRGDNDEALALLARIPESPETRHVAARARLQASGNAEVLVETDDGLEARLAALLENVRDDEVARREYLDILEAMDPDDERRARFRRALSSRLY